MSERSESRVLALVFLLHCILCFWFFFVCITKRCLVEWCGLRLVGVEHQHSEIACRANLVVLEEELCACVHEHDRTGKVVLSDVSAKNKQNNRGSRTKGVCSQRVIESMSAVVVNVR